MLKTHSKLFMLTLFFVLSFHNEEIYAESDINNGLNYLNQLRSSANMTIFSPNSLLDDSAFNHSNYLAINNTSGHFEEQSKSGFTGIYGSDRARYTHYKATVTENVFTGNVDSNTSIDQLFSAIYHRFGFLSFDKNEIGIGISSSDSYIYTNSYVYNMGNADIALLCDGESATSGYYSVCSEFYFYIEANEYESARDLSREANPELVVWPYEGQLDSIPVFYEESPDPLPDCSVSGYPMSVQFNESHVSNIEMISFKLYDSKDIEMTNTEILTKKTDPNGVFSAYEFALFPLDRLAWNSHYLAEFLYKENNIEKVKTWAFKTKAPIYPYYQVASNNQTFSVVSGKPYVIYAPPRDCNDTFNTFDYIFTTHLTVNFIEYNDYNSISVQISGEIGNILTIDLDNGISFNLQISSTDSALDNAPVKSGVTAVINSYLLL
ncbi:MAG: CAP domain-containing protein [Gammaproteobacteria bacterium]|nr:CAP domain-containing protein [Gammaproteobacteria bacterium]